ncbi:TPA: fimbrial protein [Salmonella enterica subsp. enterica serovar Java]
MGRQRQDDNRLYQASGVAEGNGTSGCGRRCRPALWGLLLTGMITTGSVNAAPLSVSLGVDIAQGSCTVGVDTGLATVTLTDVDGGMMKPHQTYSPVKFALEVDCADVLQSSAAVVPTITASGDTLIASQSVEGAYIFSGKPGPTDAQGVGVVLLISSGDTVSDMPVNLSGNYTRLMKNGEATKIPSKYVGTNNIPMARIPIVAAVTSGRSAPTNAGALVAPVTFSFSYR